MTADDLWLESFNGEIYGAEIFQAVAERQTDARRRADMEVLAQLERATRELVAPVIVRRGIDAGDVLDEARDAGTRIADWTWDEFLEWLGRVTDKYLSEYYRPLVDLSAGEERAVAEALVAHEEALATYARRAAGSEPGDALEAVFTLPHMPRSASVQ